ncbi:hypothetical protein GOBAR_AA05268 [Gossypium barbadense]|uniref:Reverse transcriptase zinc-binding domain-containing protein n=1 Tax=Gossypium barbadense TaxID=3634 RepID=A0A2P5YIE0_GOSBA|nr:hypothetical protein GOBAR_AA05268 [Gossypium barbadense]
MEITQFGVGIDFYSEASPTRMMTVNLFQRRPGSNRMCHRCGGGPETLLHACRDCPGLLELWDKLGVTWDAIPPNDETFMSWISELFDKGEQCVQIVILAIWVIWNSRNGIIHERYHQPIQSLLTFILGYAWELQSLSTEGGGCRAPILEVWRPPVEPWVRVNFDAHGKDFSGNAMSAGLRMVRVDSGEVAEEGEIVAEEFLFGHAKVKRSRVMSLQLFAVTFSSAY